VAEGRNRIEQTETLIEGMYGSIGLDWPHRHFRFPYGDKGGPHKADFQTILRNRGYGALTEVAITFPWSHEAMPRYWEEILDRVPT
jgi:hypothetical protein